MFAGLRSAAWSPQSSNRVTEPRRRLVQGDDCTAGRITAFPASSYCHAVARLAELPSRTLGRSGGPSGARADDLETSIGAEGCAQALAFGG